MRAWDYRREFRQGPNLSGGTGHGDTLMILSVDLCRASRAASRGRLFCIESSVMNASTAYPVKILHEHLRELEGAITACLADPGHKPVHKLRTETRRVEALLVLLAWYRNFPNIARKRLPCCAL